MPERSILSIKESYAMKNNPKMTRFTRFTKFTTMSTSAILLKMKVYQAHQVYQNEKTLVWPTTSLIYGSVSAGRENFSSYVTFF